MGDKAIIGETRPSTVLDAQRLRRKPETPKTNHRWARMNQPPVTFEDKPVVSSMVVLNGRAVGRSLGRLIVISGGR